MTLSQTNYCPNASPPNTTTWRLELQYMNFRETQTLSLIDINQDSQVMLTRILP